MKHYTTDEAAALLGLRPKTLRQYVFRELLTATHFGRALQFSEAELKRFMRDRRKQGERK